MAHKEKLEHSERVTEGKAADSRGRKETQLGKKNDVLPGKSDSMREGGGRKEGFFLRKKGSTRSGRKGVAIKKRKNLEVLVLKVCREKKEWAPT